MAGESRSQIERQVRGGMNGLLSRYLITRRVKAVKPYLKDCRRILDIGCGIFKWEGLLPPGSDYTGIDREEGIISYNRGHYPYHFMAADIEFDEVPAAEVRYDLVIMAAVLEHMSQPAAVLKKIRGVLSERGIIVITTPHPAGEFILNTGAAFRIFARDKETHHDLLGYNKLNSIVLLAGLELLEYKRFLFGFNQLAVMAKKRTGAWE